VKILVPGRPIAKARPRLNRKTGRFYTPRDTQTFEDLVAWHVLGSDEKFTGEVTMQIVFYMPDRKPVDIDNLIKSILDGLQKGKLIADDSQVRAIEAEIRRDEGEPRTEITIEDSLEQWVYCHSEYVRVNRKGDHYVCSGCGKTIDRLIAV
jgi:Holliday junction resolvase RusA-like endonuclease